MCPGAGILVDQVTPDRKGEDGGEVIHLSVDGMALPLLVPPLRRSVPTGEDEIVDLLRRDLMEILPGEMALEDAEVVLDPE